MASLVLYTRQQCHLCDEAKVALERVRARVPFALELVDIDGDAELRRRYDWEVPVLLVDGHKVAKYHIDEAALERRLRAGRPGADAARGDA